MIQHGPVYLASKSPRRAQLLREAGIDVTLQPADLDDAALPHGDVPPEWLVMSLAYFKARRVADMLQQQHRHHGHHGFVLGADTLCAVGRSVLGQPKGEDDALRMLRLMRGREHRTLTGVCLLPLHRPDARLIVFDAAIVRIGEVSDDRIETYVRSGHWQGKAGAYNLSERVSDGWPITCLGDPATVMGLPMQRLHGWLAKAAV